MKNKIKTVAIKKVRYIMEKKKKENNKGNLSLDALHMDMLCDR